MRTDELHLAAIHKIAVFHQDAGLLYNPEVNTTALEKYGLEPGVGARGTVVEHIKLPDPSLHDWEWRSEMDKLGVPAEGWHHMSACDCSDCMRGAHNEPRYSGGYSVVSATGQVLYDVSADGWSGD